MAPQKVENLARGIEKFLAGLEIVIELGEHPDSPALEPDVFAGIVDSAFAGEASEIAAVLRIERVAKPEGNDAVKEFRAIAPGVGVERKQVSTLSLREGG